MYHGCFNNTTHLAAGNASLEDDDTEAAAVARAVKHYVMDIAVPSVCALGLLGNLLSLIVLTTEKMHRTLTKMEISAHIGLNALAVSDFLFCLLVLIFTQASLKPFYEVGDSMLYFDYLANGLITIFIISSTWLIVVMAAERYIAVCHPLRARKVISLRRTRVSIVVVFVVCAMATIPIFLERRIDTARCTDGRYVYVLEQRSQQSLKVRRIMWAVFFDFIPCAALVYFNLCLIVQIRRAKKLRDQMTPKHTFTRYVAPATIPCSQRHSPHKYEEQTALDSAGLVRRDNGVSKTPREYVGRLTPSMRKQQLYGDYTSGAERNNINSAPSPRGRGYRTGGVGSSTRASHTSGSSTDSELRSLNQRQDPNGSISTSKMIASRCSVMKKRPSDSALNSVTATLVAVVLLFLILVSPSELLKFSLGYTLSDSHKMDIVMYVTNFMQVTNFSLNFVLYCAINKTFRHTLRGMICCCWLSIRK